MGANAVNSQVLDYFLHCDLYTGGHHAVGLQATLSGIAVEEPPESEQRNLLRSCELPMLTADQSACKQP